MMLASVTNGKQSRKLSAFIASSTVKGLGDGECYYPPFINEGVSSSR